MGLFEMMMGKLGLSILAWLQEHMEISLGVVIAYFVVIYITKYQVRRIQVNTNKLIEQTIADVKMKKRSPSVSAVLKRLKPIWTEKSKKWAVFVLGKYGLYPIPHRPEKNFDEFVSRELIQSILTNKTKS